MHPSDWRFPLANSQYVIDTYSRKQRIFKVTLLVAGLSAHGYSLRQRGVLLLSLSVSTLPIPRTAIPEFRFKMTEYCV